MKYNLPGPNGLMFETLQRGYRVFDNTLWTIATGVYDGHDVVLRFRQFPDSFEREVYPIRLNIFWKMSESSFSGMPLEAESIRLQSFEDRIVSAAEHDCHSILSVVLTGNSQREFVFHTRDDDGFLARLTGMPQETDRYPIEIIRDADAAWNYDAGVTSSIIVKNTLN